MEKKVLAQTDHRLFAIHSSVLDQSFAIGKDLMDVKPDGIRPEIDDRNPH